MLFVAFDAGGSHLPICCLLSQHNRKFLESFVNMAAKTHSQLFLFINLERQLLYEGVNSFFYTGFQTSKHLEIIELLLLNTSQTTQPVWRKDWSKPPSSANE